MKVKRIEWMDKDNDMLVVLEEKFGTMTYDTKVILPCTSLNGILSECKKQNPDFELDEFMVIEQWSEKEINYVFDFTTSNDVNFLLGPFSFKEDFRQIRA